MADCIGDPHASERIGPSCSRTQAGITLAGLMAACKGANLEQINVLQEATRGAVLRFAHYLKCHIVWMLYICSLIIAPTH